MSLAEVREHSMAQLKLLMAAAARKEAGEALAMLQGAAGGQNGEMGRKLQQRLIEQTKEY